MRVKKNLNCNFEKPKPSNNYLSSSAMWKKIVFVVGLITLIAECNGQEASIKVSLAELPASTIANNTANNNNNNNATKISTKENSPPMEFPDDETVLRSNTTLIKALEATPTTTSPKASDMQIDTESNNNNNVESNKKAAMEIEDLNKNNIENEIPVEFPHPTEPPQTNEDLAKIIFTNHTFKILGHLKKEDTELIQNGVDGDKQNNVRKDLKFHINEDKAVFEAITDHSNQNGNSIATLASAGHTSVIIASIFVFFCVSGYVGLLLWRRHLERQYGTREMLVNEEFCDPNDMKHFSI